MAAAVAEGTAKPEAALVATPITLPLATVAVWQPVPNQTLERKLPRSS